MSYDDGHELTELMLENDPRIDRLVATETKRELAKSVIYERTRAEAWHRRAEELSAVVVSITDVPLAPERGAECP